MMELLSGFPDDVLAVKGSGEITAEDYQKVFTPAALSGIRHYKLLRLYYEIASDAYFSAGAVWEDLKLGVGRWADWGRIAMVSDLQWVHDGMKLFGPLARHPLRVFTGAQAAEARQWLDEAELRVSSASAEMP